MMKATQIQFELGVVEAARLHEEDLFVRTYDAVARVTPEGTVTVLHTFDPQSPLAFKGLVLVDGRLFTIDRPLNGPPTLIELSPGGELRRHAALTLHNPTGLTALGVQPLVLDQQPPVTSFLLWRGDREQLLAEARSLTHWEVTGRALTFSDAEGLHRRDQEGRSVLDDRAGILTFDQAGHRVIQRLDEGQPVFDVITPESSYTVTGVNRPVALHALTVGTFVRFQNRLAPIGAPEDLQTLPNATDLGTVTEVSGGLAFVDDDRQLRWSVDALHWESLETDVRASDVAPAGVSDLVVSGRRASSWVKIEPSHR
ncbi:hypothetical protein LAJ19_19650 (plasmid) [Deinococcus taeanensis]|uniref:hypothetical protein n=1 Tax=Deinococcus taeanensis TaxID=2737050 RepID=UPI001CDBDE5E|nr:hypothetical protein [Deinococcus taeanensis]UBV45354.1 hypothetical protein LAJ19_19650 [Deinococcus taeanensis]